MTPRCKLKNNIVTDKEVETGRLINGKKEYVKRMTFTISSTNAGTYSFSTGLANVTYLKMEGMYIRDTFFAPINVVRLATGTDVYAIGAYITNDRLFIETSTDRSAGYFVVDLYYTKNN